MQLAAARAVLLGFREGLLQEGRGPRGSTYRRSK
jgi:hypothetical protein